MWELYDRLLEGLPSNLFIEDVNIGSHWTAVTLSNGNVGIAMTTNVQTVRRDVNDFRGMNLQEAAAYIKSWNFMEATVGMAAINSWYNSCERMEELQCRQNDTKFCTFDYNLTGKNVVMVGQMRNCDGHLEEAAGLIVLEREPKEGTYPDTACEFVIPESDFVIITGSAFINKSMPRLLQLAGEGSRKRTVIVTGPSVPMAEQLLEFGINRLTGMVVSARSQMVSFAKNSVAGPPYDMGERFSLDRK